MPVEYSSLRVSTLDGHQIHILKIEFSQAIWTFIVYNTPPNFYPEQTIEDTFSHLNLPVLGLKTIIGPQDEERTFWSHLS